MPRAIAPNCDCREHNRPGACREPNPRVGDPFRPARRFAEPGTRERALGSPREYRIFNAMGRTGAATRIPTPNTGISRVSESHSKGGAVLSERDVLQYFEPSGGSSAGSER